MDPRYNGGDLRNKLQARSVLSGRVMQNVMSGNYTKVAELTEEQNKTLRSVMLGLATGVSVPEQRHRIAQELVKTIVQ